MSSLHMPLDFRPPLAWPQLLAYLGARAIPGIEWVDACHYRRTVSAGTHRGWVAVSLTPGRDALDLEIAASLAPAAEAIAARIRHLFDLDAEPQAMAAHLAADPILGDAVRRIPGMRAPGAFDGFEIAVRAILGQQVSVRGASTLSGRWAKKFGQPVATPFAALDRLTPAAARVASARARQIGALGIVGARARAIVDLAQRVAAGEIALERTAQVKAALEALQGVSGIGAWTSEYIAMRALQCRDAFPSGDLVLRRVAALNESQLQGRAEAWRPWRSYAAHYLWSMAGAVK